MGTFYSDLMFPITDCISRPIRKEDVQIETFYCIFKHIRVNWSNIIITGILE